MGSSGFTAVLWIVEFLAIGLQGAQLGFRSEFASGPRQLLLKVSQSFARRRAERMVDSGRDGPNVGSSEDAAPWMAIGIWVTNTVNFVQFEGAFANHAQGLLTVYWNRNAIGFIDERVASPETHTYRFPLLQKVSNGLYTLSFRLDQFEERTSSSIISNVRLGYYGLKEPTLRASLEPTGPRSIELEGQVGFSYTIESSTNLIDWVPVAVMTPTNNPAIFTDAQNGSTGHIFYRAFGN
jgi:hypothetical protein